MKQRVRVAAITGILAGLGVSPGTVAIADTTVAGPYGVLQEPAAPAEVPLRLGLFVEGGGAAILGASVNATARAGNMGVRLGYGRGAFWTAYEVVPAMLTLTSDPTRLSSAELGAGITYIQELGQSHPTGTLVPTFTLTYVLREPTTGINGRLGVLVVTDGNEILPWLSVGLGWGQ